MKVKCSEIKIGERVRKDLGDIDSLADDIEELGLLQPIGVTSGNDLVFGERRLAACKSLNYEEIEVVVVDSDGLLECETAENVSRKNFIMSERVAIRKVFKAKFMKRGIKTGKLPAERGIKTGKLPAGRIKDKLAKLSGVSRRTADKEDFIVKHGNQKLIDNVDNNELSVNKVYSLIKKMTKDPEAQIDNEIDSLSVEEPVDPPIESVQLDSSIYNIVLSDSYSSITLPTSLSDKIQHYSKTIETSPLTYIMNTLVQCFENYSVGHDKNYSLTKKCS